MLPSLSQSGTIMPVLPLSAETYAFLEERGGWTAFFIGTAVTFFGAVAAGAAAIAKAVCTTAMWTALFPGGQPVAFATAAPCIAAGAISVLSASVAGGLYTYGSSQGWTFEDVGSSIGPSKRVDFEPIVHNALGIAHYYDAETHRMLNQSHGAMLATHNTTIVMVTWIETLPNVNHTGGPFENLDMTNGRIVTLKDGGIIRTALAQTSMMGSILDSFNEFKGTNYTTNPILKRSASDTLTVDWMSYATYGENMEEANSLLSGIDIDLNTVETPTAAVASWDTSFAEAGSGGYLEKFCLGASPNGDSVGQDSVIVGEVYTNQWGGIDTNCQGG